ncbi:CheR family methyltransferase [Candidatus Riflebacteria bacterium]
MLHLSISTFKKYRDLLSKKFGIEYDTSHLEQLENRIRAQVQTLCSGSYDDYLSLIQKNEVECRKFLSLISTNKTNFFRHPEQYRLLEREVLPELKNKISKADKLRILSVGCSRGAELYSILMVLEQNFNGIFTVDAIGVDIDSAELEIAKSGIFAEENMLDIPGEYSSKFFKKQEDKYLIKKELVSQAKFKFQNIMEQFELGDFDLIFCRNCLIYFKEENKARITNELYKSLKIGGFLFLSPNEFIRDDCLGSLVEFSSSGLGVYTRKNPVAGSMEYHFISNRELLKIQLQLQEQSIPYKLEKYTHTSSGEKTPDHFFIIPRDFRFTLEKIMTQIGIKAVKVQSVYNDPPFFN